jgi:FlaG/FlaF family flagellin (archaellin)
MTTDYNYKILIMNVLTLLQSKKLLLAVALFSVLGIPSTSHAAYTGPVCVLWTQTSSGSIVAAGESEVMLNMGEDITMYWVSVNATAAENGNGERIPVSGKSVKSPTKKTTYTYTFSKGTREFECSVVVHPVEASVKKSTLSTESTKPTISGTAKSTKTVSFEVFKAGTKKPVYESETIKVIDGVWKHKVEDSLPKGTYSLVLYGSDDLKLNTISKETLTIGSAADVSSGASTIVVQPIPLLSGGTVKKNQTVSLLYLQVLNVGLQPVTVTGIKMKQTGTAAENTIVTLMAVDDTELHKGQVGKIGTSPFKSGEALIPITLTIKPKETRLFTLKALLGGDVSDDVGDTLKLVVSGMESQSSVKATFPIKGVTWTIAQ